jgi:hydroxymethylglutaryl-CoA synthase
VLLKTSGGQAHHRHCHPANLQQVLYAAILFVRRQQAAELLPGLDLQAAAGAAAGAAAVQQGRALQVEQQVEQQALQALQALQASGAQFARMASDGCWLQQQLGNLYCGSLYSGLAALLERQGAHLEGRRVLLFSYGSGAMAALFCLVGRRMTCSAPGARPAADISLAGLQRRSDLSKRLAERRRIDVQRYNQLADRAASMLQGLLPAGEQTRAGMISGAAEHVLWPGAWRLQLVDAQHRRMYQRWGGSAPDV